MFSCQCSHIRTVTIPTYYKLIWDPQPFLFTETIAGDFNFDNMSPCDVVYNQHELFSLYRDPCMKAPGKRFKGTRFKVFEKFVCLYFKSMAFFILNLTYFPFILYFCNFNIFSWFLWEVSWQLLTFITINAPVIMKVWDVIFFSCSQNI